MEFKLIMLDNPIIVSDEECKEGDWVYDTFPNACPVKRQLTTIEEVEGIQKTEFKIISENPDFSDLKEKDCKRIGWVDVEKLYPTNRKGRMWMPNVDELANQYRQEGFKTAQSINDKRFSLEDMKKSWKEGARSTKFNAHRDGKEFNSFEDYIQSLQQTVWEVEVEMEGYKKNGMIDEATSYRPKITNGKVKILKVL